MDILFTILVLAVFMPMFSSKKSWQIFVSIALPLLCIVQLSLLIYNADITSITIGYNIPLSFKFTKVYLYFTFFIGILWFFANIYSVFYIIEKYGEKKLVYFTPLYNLAICSSMLITFSANLITTFIFYELLTLSTIPLVAFNKNTESRKCVTKYSFILLFTALALFLPAIFLFQNTIGTTSFTDGGTISSLFSQEISSVDLYNYSYTPSSNMMIFILLLIFFGVAKNAVFPVNGWLPAAMCAPAPVSALLHAVAVVKSGAIIIYKVIYELYGVQYFEYLHKNYQVFFLIISIVVVAGIVIASIKATLTTDIKQILALSTISNMTYIFMLFMIGTEKSMIAGFWHIIVHSLTKICLFFIAGTLYLSYHTNNYRRMSGAFNGYNIGTFASIICSLSLIGLPLTSGFVSKQFTMQALTETNSLVPLFGIIFSTLATSIYIGKPLIYLNSKSKRMIVGKNIKTINYFIILPITAINLIIFIIGFNLMNQF